MDGHIYNVSTAGGSLAQRGPERSRLTSKGEQRRQEILEASATLFDSVGYHNASMASIAESANTTKANIYHYFKAKHDILFAIHDAWIDELHEMFAATAETSPDPIAIVRGVFHDLLFLIHNKTAHVRVYFEYFRELPPELQSRAMVKRDQYETLVESTIVAGIEQGLFRAGSARVATFALFGMGNWAYQWYRPGGKFTHEEVAEQLFEIYIGGVGADANWRRMRG